jgi:MFS family permease
MMGSMVWSISIIYALELGADILEINLITTIRSTMGILLLVPFGILSDRLGRRPMVLYSRAIFTVGTLIRAFATNPQHLILASFIGGFSGGGFFPILLSMISDVAKPEELQEAISTLYLFSSFGMVIGPIITSSLLTLFQLTLRNIYQTAIIGQLALFIYLVTQIQETKQQLHQKENNKAISYITNLIHQTKFQSLLAIAFLYFFSRSIINTYIPIFASTQLNLSEGEIASFSIYRNVAIMLIRLSAATVLTKVPMRSFFIFALALGGVTSLTSIFANNYSALIIILFLSGISYGATAILGNIFVAKTSTHENRGIANSIYNTAQGIGNITKIITAPIVDALGLWAVFLLGGLTALLSTVPVLLKKIKD